MKIPLIYDEKDPKWILLCKLLKIFDSRKTHQELSKNGLTPLKRSKNVLKVIIVALFFDLNISYVVSELNRNQKLKRQLGVDEVFTPEQISEFLSRHNEKYWCEFTIKLLNSLNFKNTRGIRIVIVDGTDIQIDLNWFGRKISKKSLEKKSYKWGYSSSKGFYIGLKLTLALDCRTMQPLAMLLHEGSPNDAKIFSEIMDELKRRRIIRKGDKLLFDKGYFSKDNYQIAIVSYDSAVLIFPRGKKPLQKVFDNISYPLECFTGKNRKKKLYRSLARKSKEMLQKWKSYKGIRSKIEDFNKILKHTLSLRRIHHYTEQSINKKTYLNVLLAGLITSTGFKRKKEIQRLTEM
ncbi:MAG: transposase [Methanobrevibacter arboriphilus]|nr:transposase [Methanobrevibacter arboriphilus]